MTDIGSNRCFDPIGDKCIWPQFGSGPERNDGAGSGFVSQDEYVEILEYAYDLGIRVVPEIVAPSHAGAAVQARDLIIIITNVLCNSEFLELIRVESASFMFDGVIGKF